MSRIKKIIISPFRKSAVEEEEKENKVAEEEIYTKLNDKKNNGGSAMAIADLKRNNSTEWTKCSCCRKELTFQQTQCVPSSPKVRSCDNCQGCVCKDCRVKGICHECAVRKEVKLDPDSLMECDEDKLRSYIIMMHYPPGGFQNCAKPYLVKQILVRFKMFDDWDPKKLVSPLTNLEPIPVALLSSSELKTVDVDVNLRQKEYKEHSSKHVTEIPVSEPKMEKVEAAIITQQQATSFQADIERAVRLRNERKAATAAAPSENGAETPSHSKAEEEEEERRRRSHNTNGEEAKVELTDIKCVDDIRKLKKRQLKHILRRGNVDTKLLHSTQAYQQAVMVLWFSLNEQHEAETEVVQADAVEEVATRSHKQLHRLTYKIPFEPLSSTDIQTTPPGVSLRDVPSTSFAEKLNNQQLAEILTFHNFDPAEYPEREDMLFAVLCLWHAIKRGTTVPKILNEISKRPKKLHVELNNKNAVNLESLASPVDIEKLDPVQLRNILISNNVDPGQYENDVELYLGVVNLWSGTKNEAQPNWKPSTAVHRTEAATAKIVSNWLNSENKGKGPLKSAPLAVLDDDITFMDDEENNDFAAIDADASSSASDH